jgi:hypothetical protein
MKILPQRYLPALISIALSSGLLCAAPPAEEKDPTAADNQAAELFETKILPVLVENCYQCHSQRGESIEGGLELDSPSGMSRGGDSGPMFRAHHADQSRLLQMLRHEDDASPMPPEEKLSDDVIAAFEEWIRLGAADSRDESGPTAKEQRLTKAKRHWAFQPPQSGATPQIKDSSWPRDPLIDNFVLARIEAEGMTPAADANHQTLVRRLYYDLVGLPPSPQEINALVASESPDALGNLVDRLLDSPQFGERWGRHWLDVVRFAESSGMEFNFTYPHAWPYRNYVIDSLNADKPFDLFLREQIAGDLLPGEENEPPAAAETRRIAPSMLAFGPKRHNSSGTEFRMDIADDQIDVVFKSTLAMTVSCARCHDHKFDPIPTRDYYALTGIFLSTEPLYGTIKQKYSNTPTDLLPIGTDAQALHSAAEEYDKKIPEAEKTLAAKREELKKATEKAATSLKEEVTKLESGLEELKKNRPPRPQYAMSVRDRSKPEDAKLAIRGDFRNRGEVVPRGFLSAVNVPGEWPIESAHSGRLELARWITRANNPLTARVMVNRIWAHLFGRGIVPTVDNFGVIGKPPTHPQLLDTLALRFTEDGWSVKRMIRTIVLSRAYQLSSHVDEKNMAIDPDNRLLWRASPRRLEAETIRDAMLTVSGQLDLQRPVGSTVTGLGDKLVRSIPTEKIQPASNHRSVYLPVVRDYVPELFDLFDFPSPSLVSGQRAVTNVPSQALYLRNSAFVAEQARLAAERLLASKEATDDAARVTLAMRWALGRTPTDAEGRAALQLVGDVKKSATKNISGSTESAASHDGVVSPDAWSAWFLTLFSTAEFRYLVDIET